MHGRDKGKISHLKFKIQQKKISPILPPENYIHKENYFYFNKQDQNGICDWRWQKYLFQKLEKYKSYQPPLKQMPKVRLDHHLVNVQGITLYLPSLLGTTTQIKPNKNQKNTK